MEYYFTKSNRIIEFNNLNKNFFKYLVLKSIAFLIDYLLVLALEILLYTFTNFAWYILGLAGIVWTITYTSMMFIGFGRTLGLIATKLYAVHLSGFLTSNRELFMRGLVMSIYAFPIVGWALMFSHLVASPFWKGITLVDFVSRTAIISRHAHNDLQAKEQEIDEVKINKGVSYE